MRKTLNRLLALALLGFAVWLLVKHPHSPVIFIRTYNTGHK